MNKKGFTLIELLLSITLISVVLVSMINTMIKLRDTYNVVNDNADAEIYTAAVSRVLNEDFIKNEGISIIECDDDTQTICDITFKNGKERKLIINNVEGEEKNITSPSGNITGKRKNNYSTLKYIDVENDQLIYLKTIKSVTKKNKNNTKTSTTGYKFIGITGEQHQYPSATEEGKSEQISIITIMLNESKYNIRVSSSAKVKSVNRLKTLFNTIVTAETSFSDTVPSTYVTNSTGIKFDSISSATNGRGLYYTDSNTENNKRVYYYRGDVNNNHVIFAGYCWRIVRTNEDGTVKLRFNGINDNGTCKGKGQTTTSLMDIKFNSVYTNINNLDYNTSELKTYIENWYSTNILSQGTTVTNIIADTPYCSDHSNQTTPSSVYVSYRFYGPESRVFKTTTSSPWSIRSDSQPIFSCPNDFDKNTVANGKLSYPVALLTFDEAIYAGGTNLDNTDFYLFTGSEYWTMSPGVWTGSSARVGVVLGGEYDGRVCEREVSNSFDVYPVISLKNNVLVSSGKGTETKPYIIQ